MADPLSLRQLRYLVAVDDHRHFGHAAQACHVSQPSLSAQIRQAEEALGTALFERGGRVVSPTVAGQAIIARARRILSEVDSMVAEAQPGAAPLSGGLRLGVIPTIAPYYLPSLLPRLRTSHPNLKLYLVERQTADLLAALDEGAIDAAIMALPSGEAGLAERALYREPFLLAVPDNHRLARQSSVAVDDLAGESVLLLEDGHCFRDQALAVCRSAGAEEEAFTATSLTTLCEMVTGGLGITLVPALLAAREPYPPGRVYLPFDGEPPHRTVGLVWRHRTPRPRTMAALARFLADYKPVGLASTQIEQASA
jgi:LysR family hydrogen peroxide-inducible transcriptional activator